MLLLSTTIAALTLTSAPPPLLRSTALVVRSVSITDRSLAISGFVRNDAKAARVYYPPIEGHALWADWKNPKGGFFPPDVEGIPNIRATACTLLTQGARMPFDTRVPLPSGTGLKDGSAVELVLRYDSSLAEKTYREFGWTAPPHDIAPPVRTATEAIRIKVRVTSGAPSDIIGIARSKAPPA